MMKNYKITVNGNTYNVTVEEGTGAVGSVPAAPVQAAAPDQTKTEAPAAASEAAQAVRPAGGSGAEGSVKVEAPMSGKILAVKVAAGDKVKRGDVIAVLEAMKMENDIVAPEDGSIVSVNCSAGEQVESGAVLATLDK